MSIGFEFDAPRQRGQMVDNNAFARVIQNLMLKNSLGTIAAPPVDCSIAQIGWAVGNEVVSLISMSKEQLLTDVIPTLLTAIRVHELRTMPPTYESGFLTKEKKLDIQDEFIKNLATDPLSLLK